MVSFRFQVVAALVAAAAAVQANDHELEVRDWEERRLAPRNFELITTKLTLLVPKGSYKTVTKYKTVTVTGDCGGTTLTDPVPTPTDTFTIPPTPTDTGLPTDTLTGVPTPTDTGLPTDTLTGIPTPTDTGFPTPTNTGLPTDTLTGAPTPTDTAIPTPTNTGLPTDTLTGAPTPTDTGLPTDTLTTPIVDPTANATQPTTTFGVPAVNATIAAGGDPFAQTTPTLDILGTSTDTVVVTITSDPTAPTPTAPSIVKRVAQVI